MDNHQVKIQASQRTELVQEYYFSHKLRQIEEMRKAGADIINLGIGSPDLPPAPAVVNKLSETAHLPNVHGYQSYNAVSYTHLDVYKRQRSCRLTTTLFHLMV